MARHTTRKSYHLRGIRHNQPVKSHLFPQYSLHQFFTQGSRHNFFIFYFRIDFPAQGGLLYMGAHNGRRTIIYQLLINFPISFIPLFRRQAVDTAHQMLISIIYAITREMFDCTYHIIIPACIYVAFRHTQNPLRAASVCPYIRYRVFRVEVNIHNWLECPVYTACTALPASYFGQLISGLRIIGSRTSHRAGNICTICQSTVSS